MKTQLLPQTCSGFEDRRSYQNGPFGGGRGSGGKGESWMSPRRTPTVLPPRVASTVLGTSGLGAPGRSGPGSTDIKVTWSRGREGVEGETGELGVGAIGDFLSGAEGGKGGGRGDPGTEKGEETSEGSPSWSPARRSIPIGPRPLTTRVGCPDSCGAGPPGGGGTTSGRPLSGPAGHFLQNLDVRFLCSLLPQSQSPLSGLERKFGRQKRTDCKNRLEGPENPVFLVSNAGPPRNLSGPLRIKRLRSIPDLTRPDPGPYRQDCVRSQL